MKFRYFRILILKLERSHLVRCAHARWRTRTWTSSRDAVVVVVVVALLPLANRLGGVDVVHVLVRLRIAGIGGANGEKAEDGQEFAFKGNLKFDLSRKRITAEITFLLITDLN